MSWHDEFGNPYKYYGVDPLREIREQERMIKEMKSHASESQAFRDMVNETKYLEGFKEQQRQLAEWSKQATLRYGGIPGSLTGADLAALGIPTPSQLADTSSYTATPSAYSIPDTKLVNEIDTLAGERKKKESTLAETREKIAKSRDDQDIEEIKKQYELQIRELAEINTKLENTLKFYNLHSQVSTEAKIKLENDKSFAEKFSGGQDNNCYVLSVDIRKSTELMLKAKSEKHFELYIRTLCEGFKDIITKNYGVFDKFTGDGILAYFPSFYSGPDAWHYMLQSANDCLYFFKTHYNNNRHNFHVVLHETSVGIGVDYGNVHFALINSYTVVGRPVVYACRLSSACSNSILINQSAFDAINEKHSDSIKCNEEVVSIKHEDPIISYRVQDYDKDYQPQRPEWLQN